MAFITRNVLVFLALFRVRIVAVTFPPSGSASLSSFAPEMSPTPDVSPEPPSGSPNLYPLAPEMAPTPDVYPEPSIEPKVGVFDVTEHGAVADGSTESSWAFSSAWSAACNYTRNCTFNIPEGRFLVGPISFTGPCKNNRSPNIEIRGTLLAPASLSAFRSIWIAFKDLQGFTLTGGSKTSNLDGQGAAAAWRQSSCATGNSPRCKKLITSLEFINVSYATIRDITLSNSKGFHLAVHQSNNININNVRINAPADSPNTDGIHTSYSSNINISSSTIGVGDDCVSIGPGSINISITDLHCSPGHGISIGSLGYYDDEGDVSGIIVKNCALTDTDNGVRIKTYRSESPSNASGIILQDLNMTRVRNPIIIDQEYGTKGSSQESKVSISDVQYINITGTTVSNIGVKLLCSASNPCQRIYLKNVGLQYVGPPTDQPFSSNCRNANVTSVGFQNPPSCVPLVE